MGLRDPRISELADRHRHLPKMIPLLALINLPLFEAGFSDQQGLSVNPPKAMVLYATVHLHLQARDKSLVA